MIIRHDTSIPTNTIYIFKDHDPVMAEHASQDRVFFQMTCEGQPISYTVAKLNHVFEAGINTESMQQRFVSLMHYLQQGYHAGKYRDTPAEYEHAQEEYPQRYLALVNGLSGGALEKIKALRMSEWTQQLPDDLGAQFATKLLEDRQKLQTPRIEPSSGEWRSR